MDLNNVAAYSLQAGMTIGELLRLLETLGKVPDKAQVAEIKAIRRQLRSTARELR